MYWEGPINLSRQSGDRDQPGSTNGVYSVLVVLSVLKNKGLSWSGEHGGCTSPLSACLCQSRPLLVIHFGNGDKFGTSSVITSLLF